MAITPNQPARPPSPDYSPTARPDAKNFQGQPDSTENRVVPDGENGTPDPNAPPAKTASKDEHEKSIG